MKSGSLSMVLCLALSACGGQTDSNATTPPPDLLLAVKQRHELIVATDANYAPQSYLKSDGTWVGFDVDVAREIARHLGVKAQFEDTNFDSITVGNWHGRWDVNIDSMTVTTDRKRDLLFTSPYYFVPAAFVVHKDSRVTGISQLAGTRIGVGSATTYQAYLRKRLPGDIEPILVPPPASAKPIPYLTDQLALQDLGLGDGARLNAVLTALPTASAAIKAGAPLRVIQQPVFFEDDAVALDRHSESQPEPLLAAIDDALAEMLHDGTLSRLSKKYYGADFTRRH